MRERVSAEALGRFMRAVGRAGRTSARIYFVGGDRAVIFGWRKTTIDIDLKLVPEINEILRIRPELYKYPAIDAKSFRHAVEEFVSNIDEASI